MRITSAGNVGIGTTSPWRTLSVTGTVGFDGLTGSTGAGSLCLSANKQVVYNSGSDACLSSTRATKHDIAPLSFDALALVEKLQPVSFVYNEGDARTRYGFIAEETAAANPHLATYDASGTISGIDDRSILSIVVKAVQALIARLDSFADHFTTRELTFTRATGDEIVANRLCANRSDGTPVCVTGDQLDVLLSAAGKTAAPSFADPTPAPTDNQIANPSPAAESSSSLVATTSPETPDNATSSPVVTESAPPASEPTASDSPPLAPDEPGAEDLLVPDASADLADTSAPE